MTADATHLQSPFGSVQLQRYPARRQERLQAWCSADELLLDALCGLAVPSEQVLVANDEHGALTVPVNPRALWTDSALAAIAVSRNLAANHRDPVPVIWSTSALPQVPPACVVLRIPKQLPYFEYQLAQLSGQLPAGATVLAAGMDKHLSPRTASLLEHYIGPTQRHRGRRKARLFQAVKDPGIGSLPAPDMCCYFCDTLQAQLCAMPNVFSREKLDGGSRLLLQQLAVLPPVERLVDLACGNGVLGLAAFKMQLAGQVLCCDESAMAVASAQHNARQLFPTEFEHFEFLHGDGLLDYRGAAAQLVLCNPPFHSQHTVDEYVGRRLLAQCSEHLAAGGSLCLVANRHLDYRATLRRGFDRVDKLAGDSKFTVWLAQRNAPE